jgi:hypothetical protein
MVLNCGLGELAPMGARLFIARREALVGAPRMR